MAFSGAGWAALTLIAAFHSRGDLPRRGLEGESPTGTGKAQALHAEQDHPAPTALRALGGNSSPPLCLYPHHEKQEVAAQMLSKVSPAS